LQSKLTSEIVNSWSKV